MKLAFLISLPRSGSTLLQRSLAAHPDIYTAAEPWVLLPLLAWRAPVWGRAEYDYEVMRTAVNEFMGEDRLARFRDMLRTGMPQVYSEAHSGVFVDKTPRYALILEELEATFPDAKFIVLTRSPMSIVNSMLDVWGRGGKKWILSRYKVDLYDGLRNIVKFMRCSKAEKYILRYEDYVREPDRYRSDLFRFLGVRESAELTDARGVAAVEGSMGDPGRLRKYQQSVSTGSLDNADHICNSLRRKRLVDYLRDIGPNELSAYGYELETLLDKIKHQEGQRHLLSDVWYKITSSELR